MDFILTDIKAKGDSLKGACADQSRKFGIVIYRISIIHLEGA